MTLTSAITKKFDNNYVQVEISSNKQESVYYKVPEDKADAFQREFIQYSKKTPWISMGMTLGAITALIVPVSFLTKKIASRTARMFLGTLAGLTGGVGSMYLGTRMQEKNYSKMLNKYDAQELDYSNTDFPVK